ncbi:MAG: sensor histidine kinase [Acidimicrobiia bacterium]
MSAAVDASDPALTRLRRGMGRRLREPTFWIIQASVLLITAIHIAVEAEAIRLGVWEALPSAHHLPVILYLAPVAYAGLVYGWEGGVLTGLWAGVLASINIPIWHVEDFEWVLEIVFVVVVIGMGVVMAFPVESERKQRRRAEAAARRLEALNELVGAAVTARTPSQAATAVLDGLVDLMDLDDAGFVLWREEQSEPVVSVVHKTVSELSRLVADRAAFRSRTTTIHHDGDLTSIEVPAVTDDLAGFLIVVGSRDDLEDAETAEFVAAVGNQLAARVENVMLLEQEQVMLSTYVKLVTEAQEEERRRLARDLHDGPAQNLAILVRSLEGHAGEESGWIDDLHESASGILGDLRRVARDQRPTLLDDLGIVAALEWLISDSEGLSDVVINLVVDGDARRLGPETEVVFYRIAQEALRNAQEHAGANRIEIRIRFGEDRIDMTISDNGKGFQVPRSPGEYLRSGRLGLMGMHERAQLVGGSLQIQSSFDTGTLVQVRIPS